MVREESMDMASTTEYGRLDQRQLDVFGCIKDNRVPRIRNALMGFIFNGVRKTSCCSSGFIGRANESG